MIAEIMFRAMGSQVRVILDTPDPAAVETLNEVPGWFEIWEQHLSRFRTDSELSLVNVSAGRPCQVSEIFASVMDASLNVAEFSGGLVTPTVHDALIQAGYRSNFPDFTVGEIKAGRRRPVPDVSCIEWNVETREIYLPPGLRLDFGGVAKGWAAEQTANRLEPFGRVLVDAGGDICLGSVGDQVRTSGERGGDDPWIVGVADPFRSAQMIERLALCSGAVATSGTDYRRWQAGTRWQHHIIDPRTGVPAETDVISATVIAPSILIAEAAAKSAVILGSGEGMDWIDSHPDLEAVLVLENGSTRVSSGLNRYSWKES